MKQMHVQTFESSSKSAWNFICSNEIIGKKFNLLTKNVVSNNCQWRVAAAAAALSLVNVVVVTLDVGLSTVKKKQQKKEKKTKNKKKAPLHSHTEKRAAGCPNCCWLLCFFDNALKMFCLYLFCCALVSLSLSILQLLLFWILLYTHTHTWPTSAHSPSADYIYRVFFSYFGVGWLAGWLPGCWSGHMTV